MVTSLQDWRERRRASPPLSELDWKVVAIARTDGSLSLNPEGLLARIARGLFNIPVAQSLANSKLEALRRFAVRAWHWDVIRDRDLRAFLGAGYSRVDVLEILSHVGMSRGFSPSVEYQATPRSSRSRTHCRCG